MNRKHLFLVAFVAALGITFAGATSAFGASVQFTRPSGAQKLASPPPTEIDPGHPHKRKPVSAAPYQHPSRESRKLQPYQLPS